jgi:CheY-like chemotaxis protein
MQASRAKRRVPASILLVDDNKSGLAARKAILEEQCFQVVTAANGDDALVQFVSGSFDLVVTDFKMPKMNGTELIRRLREAQPGVRIVLLSGCVASHGLDEGSTGADVVLAKGPNEVTHLVRAVNRLLTKRTARRPPRKAGGASGAGAKSA